MSVLPGTRADRLPLAAVAACAALGVAVAALAVAPGPARAAVARPSAGQGAALPSVYPAPQQMQARPESIELPATVGEVVGRNTDSPALQAVNSLLRSAGVQNVVARYDDQPAPQEPVVVYAGGPGENSASAGALARLGVTGPGGLPAEGYVLGAGRDSNGTGLLVLAGVDGTGTFYAAQTLRQLIQTGNGIAKVHGVTVRDWPSMPVRGVIEGFYGPPWSTADRISSFAFDGQNKMNTYVYSPKDDPYLRAQWRDPYPSAQLAVIKQLIDAAAANHVTFTYALSPGLSMCFSSSSDLQALLTKFQSLWDTGARAFAIPFDDINYSAWNCPGDQAMFGPPGAADAAKAQVHVLNAVQDQFIATHPGAAPLEFVPTEYANTSATPYKQVIAGQLDPAVVVEWTGDGVIVPQITATQAAAARQAFGHSILVWDNYPVNDYVTGRLLMGPYTGRAATLSQYLAGVTANPMIQEEASKIALFTAGAYFWNNAGYDSSAAWQAGIKAIGGPAWPALQVFAENNYSSTLNPGESPVLTPLIAAFWKAWSTGANLTTAANNLLAYFGRMSAAPAQLRSGLNNPGFLSEVAPWLDKLGRYGEAGSTAVNMLLAERDGHPSTALSGRSTLQDQQAALSAIPQQVAAGVMDPFLAKSVSASEQSPAAALTVTASSSTVLPGKPMQVTETLTNTSGAALTGVSLGLPAQPGFQVTPANPSPAGNVTAGGKVSATWTVTPSASLPSGPVQLLGWARYTTPAGTQALLGGAFLRVPYASRLLTVSPASAWLAPGQHTTASLTLVNRTSSQVTASWQASVPSASGAVSAAPGSGTLTAPANSTASVSVTLDASSTAATATDPVVFTASASAGPVAPVALPVQVAATRPGAGTAYVDNFSSRTVSPVNLASGTAGAPITAGAQPGSITASPDGGTVYVANQGSNTVTVIDTATGQVRANWPVGAVPAGLAVSADGGTLWVSDYGDNAVQPVSTATGAAGAEIPVGHGPENLALTPDGSTLLVANKADGTLSPVSTSSRTAGTAIPAGAGAFDVAVTPDGQTAYVTDENSTTVTPIDLAAGSAEPAITVHGNPFGLAISPDGTTLYVADTSGATVDVVDVATGTAEQPITVGSAPTWIAFSPDGATAYVCVTGNNTLVPVDVTSSQPGNPVTVGQYPIAVAVASP